MSGHSFSRQPFRALTFGALVFSLFAGLGYSQINPSPEPEPTDETGGGPPPSTGPRLGCLKRRGKFLRILRQSGVWFC